MNFPKYVAIPKAHAKIILLCKNNIRVDQRNPPFAHYFFFHQLPFFSCTKFLKNSERCSSERLDFICSSTAILVIY